MRGGLCLLTFVLRLALSPHSVGFCYLGVGKLRRAVDVGFHHLLALVPSSLQRIFTGGGVLVTGAFWHLGLPGWAMLAGIFGPLFSFRCGFLSSPLSYRPPVSFFLLRLSKPRFQGLQARPLASFRRTTLSCLPSVRPPLFLQLGSRRPFWSLSG